MNFLPQNAVKFLPLVLVVSRPIFGLQTLYRGTSPALLVAIIENSVVFGVNSVLKQMYYGYFSPKESNIVETAVLGGLSGVFSALAISPAETVKIRLQQTNSNLGAWAVLRNIIKEEGGRALFQGLPAQLPRDVLFNFFFFPAFDISCLGLARITGVSSKNDLGVGALVFAGGLAGAVG